MTLPSYKDIFELIKKGSTLEAQEKIIELREAALEFQNENLELKDRIKDLESALLLKDSLQWQKPYYIDRDHPENKFCQKCYDVDGITIRLQEESTGYWVCKNCKNNYKDSNYRQSGGHVTPIRF